MTLQERLKRAESGRQILYKGSDGSVIYKGDDGMALPAAPSDSLEDQRAVEELGEQRYAENGMRNWASEVDQFVSRAAKDSESRSGVWQDTSVFSDYQQKQSKTVSRLLDQSSTYKDFFNSRRNVYGDDKVDSILSALDSETKRLSGVTSMLDEEGKFRGQFLDQGEYDTYQRLSSAGLDDLKRWNDELSEEISGLKRQLRERTRTGLTSDPAATRERYAKIESTLAEKEQLRNRILTRYYQMDNEEKLAKLGQDSEAQSLYQTAGLDTASRSDRDSAIEALAGMGYDYNRLAQYQQTQKDAQRYAQQQEEIAAEAREHPGIANAVSILASPFQGLNYIDQAIRALTNGSPDDIENYVPLNPYNMGAVNYVSGVQGTTAEDIEKAFPNAELFGVNVPSFGYQTGSSILNSAYQVGLMGPASIISMGGAAAASEMQDIIARGGSNQQALMGGTAAGIAEMLFEKLSVENLVKPKSVTGWKSLVKETAKQAGIEASEETFTEIANIVSDAAIMGQDSRSAQAVREYMLQGMSREEAEKQVMLGNVKDVVLAGVGGALSGGVMGGVSGAFNLASGGVGQAQDDMRDVARRIQDYRDSSTGWRQELFSIWLGEQDSPLAQAARDVATQEIAAQRAQEPAQAPVPQAVQNTDQAARTAQEATQGAAEAIQRARADTEIVGRDDSARRSAGSGPVTDGAPSGRALQTDTAARDITAQQRTAAMENANALVRAAATFGESGRKAFGTAWDGQQSAERYYAGFAVWYQAGLTGKAQNQVRGPYAGNLSQDQRYAAYTAGQNDAAASLAKEKAAAPYAKTAGTEAGLYDAGDLDADMASRMDAAAKLLGARVYMVDSVEDGRANGQYSGSDILIARDAENPEAQVFGHEVTHRVQELAPEAYRVFRQAALENSADSAVRAKIENYREQGLAIQYEAAMDDVAADYAGQLMEDGAALDQFIERHRTDKSLLEKVRDAFRALWQKLTGAEKRKAQTAEGKLSAALDEAAEQAKTLNQGKNSALDGEGGQGGEGEVKYSLKEFKDGRRFVEVDTDQAQFDGLSEREQGRLATKIIKERFMGKVIGLENRAYVNSRTAGEYGFPLNHLNADQHDAKMRASTELDNLMDAGTNFRTAPDGQDGHTHPDAAGDFQYFDTTFKVGGQYYTGVINIMQTAHGLVLKDITKIRNITQDISGSYGDKPQATFLRDTSMDSVPQSGGESKPQYSLKGATITKTYNQLLRENDALRERVEYWRGQTRTTKEVTTDKKAVAAAAKSLVKEYGANLDTGELAGRLQALYDSMATGRDGKNELGPTDAWKGAEAIARDIAGAAVEEWSLDQEFPGLKNRLKTTTITLGHEYDSDIHNENFRREYRGKLKLSADGPTNVDAVYSELAEDYPGLFPSDITHPADQMEQIMAVADSLATVQQQARFDGQMEVAVTGITNEIVEGFFDLPQTRATFADRQAAKLDAAKAQGKQRVQETREQYQARMQELRDSNRQAVQRVLDRERVAREKQVNELKSKYKARTEEGRERQKAGELRQKITRHAKKLSEKLLRPTDKAHIPEELRAPVAKVLESINLEGQYTIDPETGKRTKGGDGNPTKRTQAFLDLKQKYADINENGGDIVIDPTLLGSDEGSLDAVIAMGDTRLADMTSEQLGTVWQVVKAVEHSVSTAGKLLAKGKYERTSQWADALEKDTRTRRTKRPLTKKHVSLDLENPYTFFSHFGQAGKDMYRTLRDAQDRQQVLTNQVADAAEKVVGGDGKKAAQTAEKLVKKLEKSTREYTTEGGQKLTLSTAQAMELYVLSKRKQAQEHLLTGGIVQPEVPGTKVRRGTEAIHLTQNDLVDITGSLSADEKKIADGLQNIASTILSDMGNEASMQAYGYKKFTEPDYWPIRSAREGLHSNIEKGGDNARSIKNIGMAQATKPHANNQVDIGSIFDTFARHTGDMVDYAAWLLPMEDLNRLYNYQYRDGEGNPTGRTVKGILDAKGGEGAQKYWQDLMEDIQNGIKAKSDSAFVDTFSKGVGKFKASAVGGNIRVIVQQPTALLRAAAVMNPADMAAGLAKGATKGFGWQKAKQYSPIAMRKDAGGFDISSPGTMKETLFGKTGTVDKINDFLGKGAGAADAWTWGKLWNASEWQVARQHKELTKGSKAFYEEVNRVFTDMIDQTQVVDGILQRANIMRTSNAMGQQATSFMGEPIMSLNLTMRAWDQLRNEQDSKKRGKAIKNFGRAVTALTVTAAVNALAQSLVDGLRDDDKDKKYSERFWSAFYGQEGDEGSNWEKALSFVLNGNMGQGLNPANQIPYIKDVMSILQGYDVSRAEFSVIEDIVEAGQSFIKNADGTGPRTMPYSLNKLFASAAKMYGLPVSNVERDVWSIARSIAIETGSLPLQYEMEKAIYNIGSEKNKSRFSDIMYRALEAGEMDTYLTIREDMMRLTPKVDGTSLDSTMKSRYKSHLEKDPSYTLPQRSLDLLGIRTKLDNTEKEDSFGADDLDNEAYNTYAGKRADSWRAMSNNIAGSKLYKQLSNAEKDKAMDYAWEYAHQTALAEASGGKYKPSSEWIADAQEAQKNGVEPWEFALDKAAYSTDTAYKALESGDLEEYRALRGKYMDILGKEGTSVDAAMRRDYEDKLEENPNYALNQAAMDLIGIHPSDSSDSGDSFGADDLGRAAYDAYTIQRSEVYRETVDGLKDLPSYKDMDQATIDTLVTSAYTMAHQTALADNSGGQYTPSYKWVRNSQIAQDEYDIDAGEFLLWYTATSMTSSDRDENNKEIKGRKKSDKLRNWLSQEDLTYEQKAFLWGTEYTSEW